MIPGVPARVRRVEVEEAFRATWRRVCDAAGVSISELAEHHLGMRRNDLYETFDGPGHARLAHLELLPAEAELVLLRERARARGYVLTPARGEHACLRDLATEAGTALASIATSEADGFVGPAEAITDLAVLDRLERVVAQLKEHRQAAIEQRGLAVAKGA